MDKNKVIAFLIALIGLMTITLLVIDFRDSKDRDRGGGCIPPPPPPSKTNEVAKIETKVNNGGKVDEVAKIETKTIIDCKTNTVVEVAPKIRSVERRPLEPEATKRLHDGPVIVSSLFEASGLGEHANLGKAIRGSYLYATTVIAKSEIVEKNEDKVTGKVRVVERRKFLQARDKISVSDVDFVIALDTLPVDQVKGWVDNACQFIEGTCVMISGVAPVTTPFTAIVGGGTIAIKSAVATAFAALHKIDGTSARGLLGAFGVKIPENLEAFANDRISQWVRSQLTGVHVALQSIEGKSFLITYTQDANGKPLNIDYTNEDGKPITDAEWEILRSANVFLDSNVVPDKRCRVGDSWTVWADEMQELFGVVGDGRAEGKIRIERVDDQPDGNWTLKLEPTKVQFRSSDGTAAGEMEIKDGNGHVDAKNAAVKSLHATAGGNLRSLNKKRHFLFFDFVKRIEGNSNLRFTLTADPAK